jgi:hypothetical protein
MKVSGMRKIKVILEGAEPTAVVFTAVESSHMLEKLFRAGRLSAIMMQCEVSLKTFGMRSVAVSK